jgi:hypothetical protein
VLLVVLLATLLLATLLLATTLTALSRLTSLTLLTALSFLLLALVTHDQSSKRLVVDGVRATFRTRSSLRAA